jgi:hypothetical protein
MLFKRFEMAKLIEATIINEALNCIHRLSQQEDGC